MSPHSDLVQKQEYEQVEAVFKEKGIKTEDNFFLDAFFRAQNAVANLGFLADKAGPSIEDDQKRLITVGSGEACKMVMRFTTALIVDMLDGAVTKNQAAGWLGWSVANTYEKYTVEIMTLAEQVESKQEKTVEPVLISNPDEETDVH